MLDQPVMSCGEMYHYLMRSQEQSSSTGILPTFWILFLNSSRNIGLFFLSFANCLSIVLLAKNTLSYNIL